MKMSSTKLITFFMMALILFSTVSHASARRGRIFHQPSAHHEVVEHDEKAMEFEESCDGIGEDECLMRRTLRAHTDFLYTQEQKN